MGKAFNYERAEQEANKIGLEFAHSNDVVKDMSRAYHVDFSNIRVHTDSAADNKVKAAGKDALAQGNDIFFGKGIFESSDPADKGLVAHEFAHTMQQGAAFGGEMAVAESAPMGMAQGGLKEWFAKRKEAKRIKEIENMQISEPTLMKGSGPAKRNYGKAERGYTLDTMNQLGFESEQSRALYELTKNMSPEELRSEGVKNAILGTYKTDMASRLSRYEDKSYDAMYSEIIRGNSAGEQTMFNRLIDATVSDEMREGVVNTYSKNSNVDDVLGELGEKAMADPAIMEILQAGMEGMSGSKHFSGENEINASRMMMNSLVLRGITPALATKGGNAREAYYEEQLKKTGQKHTNQLHGRYMDEAKAKGIGVKYETASTALMKSLAGEGKTAGAKSFLSLLKGRFKK